LALLFLLPPLLANFLAAVLALGTTDTGPFVTSVTALFVITDSVVNALERHEGWSVALVFTVKSGQYSPNFIFAFAKSVRNPQWRVA
jgi:hypothetical protein